MSLDEHPAHCVCETCFAPAWTTARILAYLNHLPEAEQLVECARIGAVIPRRGPVDPHALALLNPPPLLT